MCRFTIGHAWVSDYGSPDSAKDFECILKYSPLHNVRPPAGGTKQYPAFLITTGSHDDRVVPLHSHKLTATLQHVLAGSPESPQRNPLLTRVEVRAGHGAGKPTSKVIEETAGGCCWGVHSMLAHTRMHICPGCSDKRVQRDPSVRAKAHLPSCVHQSASLPAPCSLLPDMFAFAAACIGAKWRHTKA